VLILDEPTAGLDPRSHSDILNMVRSVHSRTGSIVMLVSHNMGDIAEMSDRVFVMDTGQLARAGTPAEVFADGDYLRGLGLGQPPATEMAARLGLGMGLAAEDGAMQGSVVAASEPQSGMWIADQVRNDDFGTHGGDGGDFGAHGADGGDSCTHGADGGDFGTHGADGGAGCILSMDGLVDAIVARGGVS
ncbi:MAG: hypothetical protein LBG50_03000, partial [Clostridiales Family XIII bacterium]|jgi:hypothetical protein|nr:hypothetical protein [Clostridiales Family XIII bacterium]